MGYSTDFIGSFTVSPPLNEREREFLHKFNQTRRMDREQGPYYVDDPAPFGQGREGVRDFNKPPKGQPGLWCQWAPSDDGTEILWDGGEKAYDMADWIVYIIEHFLKPGAKAKDALPFLQCNHSVNGTVIAQGEDPGDRWKILIVDNEVEVITDLDDQLSAVGELRAKGYAVVVFTLEELGGMPAKDLESALAEFGIATLEGHRG